MCGFFHYMYMYVCVCARARAKKSLHIGKNSPATNCVCARTHAKKTNSPSIVFFDQIDAYMRAYARKIVYMNRIYIVPIIVFCLRHTSACPYTELLYSCTPSPLSDLRRKPSSMYPCGICPICGGVFPLPLGVLLFLRSSFDRSCFADFDKYAQRGSFTPCISCSISAKN